MTKQEAMELLDAYDADPDGFTTCDNLCDVGDALDLPNEPYTSEELREMVEEQLTDDES